MAKFLSRKRAEVGEVISVNGRQYRVIEVLTASNGFVELYDVYSITSGLPNAFSPAEVEGIVRSPNM